MSKYHIDLKSRAVLVRFGSSHWTGVRTDAEATSRVAEDFDADKNAGKFQKQLVCHPAFDQHRNLIYRARSYHKATTLPWMGTWRLLPIEQYDEYMSRMREYQAKSREIAEAIRDEYWDEIKEEAKARLGKLYREEEFPNPETLSRRFAIHVSVTPVPDYHDVRLEIDDDTVESIREQAAREFTTRIDAAMHDLWQRLHAAVERLHARASADGKFHKSVMEQLSAAVEAARQLNVTCDPALDQMANEIEQRLRGVTVESIRKDGETRAKVASIAETLLTKMAGYVGQQQEAA